MKREPAFPTFKDDREAADFWATHDSTPHVGKLREVAVKVSPAQRRRSPSPYAWSAGRLRPRSAWHGGRVCRIRRYSACGSPRA